MPNLTFAGLEQLHSGLTAAIAQTFHEAASICLARHHEAPIDFSLEEHPPANLTAVTLNWPLPSDQLKRAWANTNDATEAGACALGIAAVFLTRGLHVVARAETWTGADYFLAPRGQEPDDLEDCFRLELSGVDSGDVRLVHSRVASKLMQAGRGNVDTPAIAAVTGFKSKLIVLADLQ